MYPLKSICTLRSHAACKYAFRGKIRSHHRSSSWGFFSPPFFLVPNSYISELFVQYIQHHQRDHKKHGKAGVRRAKKNIRCDASKVSYDDISYFDRIKTLDTISNILHINGIHNEQKLRVELVTRTTNTTYKPVRGGHIHAYTPVYTYLARAIVWSRRNIKKKKKKQIKAKQSKANAPLFNAILARNSRDVATSGCLDPSKASLSCNALSCKGSASLSLPFCSPHEKNDNRRNSRTTNRQLQLVSTATKTNQQVRQNPCYSTIHHSQKKKTHTWLRTAVLVERHYGFFLLYRA